MHYQFKEGWLFLALALAFSCGFFWETQAAMEGRRTKREYVVMVMVVVVVMVMVMVVNEVVEHGPCSRRVLRSVVSLSWRIEVRLRSRDPKAQGCSVLGRDRLSVLRPSREEKSPRGQGMGGMVMPVTHVPTES
jgi:hypothetical protein